MVPKEFPKHVKYVEVIIGTANAVRCVRDGIRLTRSGTIWVVAPVEAEFTYSGRASRPVALTRLLVDMQTVHLLAVPQSRLFPEESRSAR